MGTPIAILAMTRASRSARFWAVLLEEGLREGIESHRQRAVQSLPKSWLCMADGSCGFVGFIPHEAGLASEDVWTTQKQAWWSEELTWLGCAEDEMTASQSEAAGHLHNGIVGVPMQLSITC